MRTYDPTVHSQPKPAPTLYYTSHKTSEDGSHRGAILFWETSPVAICATSIHVRSPFNPRGRSDGSRLLFGTVETYLYLGFRFNEEWCCSIGSVRRRLEEVRLVKELLGGEFTGTERATLEKSVMSLTLTASQTDMSSPRVLKSPLQKICLIFNASNEISLNYDLKGFSYKDFDSFVRQRFRVNSDTALKYTQEYEGKSLSSGKTVSMCGGPPRVLLMAYLSCTNASLPVLLCSNYSS